ncbi:MAG: META domain-containing protein [Aeromicrobium sp.]|nr:META domain-containing protein [Aeromicrobium sp.]
MAVGFRVIGAIALVVSLAAFAGCSQAGGAALEGSSWRLVASSVSSVDLGAAGITATFTDGSVGGTGGVNSYSASYALGRSGSIEIGMVTSTLMASADEDLNRAEAAYFALLPEVARWSLDEDGRLVLADEGGSPLLVFMK